MFKIDRSKNPTTPFQRILTIGLILFMAYVYISSPVPEPAKLVNPATTVIAVKNNLTGEIEEFPVTTTKLDLSIKAGDINELKKKKVGKETDLISIFEINLAAPKAAEAKPEPEKSNLDAKPVSN